MNYANEYPNAIDLKDPGFMGSVFGFFALALLITAGGTFGGFYLAGTNPELFANPVIFYGAIIVELIMAFTAHKWSRALPMGYLVFAGFALLSGFTMVPILAVAGATGGAIMIVKALFASVCVFAAAGLYGWVTKTNLLGMGGFLFMALIGLIAVSVLGIFFPWGNTMELVVSGGAILLFSGFVMYDIQVLQRTNLANPILGAIMLYISFINIFVSILRFMLAFGRD
jgi:FtsH-binding integral membrane protein